MSEPSPEPMTRREARRGRRDERRARKQGAKMLKAAYAQAARDIKSMDPTVRERIGRADLTKGDLRDLAQLNVNRRYDEGYGDLSDQLGAVARGRVVQATGAAPSRFTRWRNTRRGTKVLKQAFTQAARDARHADPAVLAAIGRSRMQTSDLAALANRRMDEVFRPEGRFTALPPEAQARLGPAYGQAVPQQPQHFNQPTPEQFGQQVPQQFGQAPGQQFGQQFGRQSGQFGPAGQPQQMPTQLDRIQGRIAELHNRQMETLAELNELILVGQQLIQAEKARLEAFESQFNQAQGILQDAGLGPQQPQNAPQQPHTEQPGVRPDAGQRPGAQAETGQPGVEPKAEDVSGTGQQSEVAAGDTGRADPTQVVATQESDGLSAGGEELGSDALLGGEKPDRDLDRKFWETSNGQGEPQKMTMPEERPEVEAGENQSASPQEEQTDPQQQPALADQKARLSMDAAAAFDGLTPPEVTSPERARDTAENSKPGSAGRQTGGAARNNNLGQET